MRYTTAGDGESYQGAFVTFPAATLNDDPAGLINSSYPTPGLTTAQSPVLHGVPEAEAPFYDAAEERWLPAGAGQTSPDGAVYAYGTNTSSIRVVTVGTGGEQTVTVRTPTDSGAGIVVEDFDGTSAYFALNSILGHPQGIWRIEVATAGVESMVQVSNVFAVRDGSAGLDFWILTTRISRNYLRAARGCSSTAPRR
jgi:hypothetical protein